MIQEHATPSTTELAEEAVRLRAELRKARADFDQFRLHLPEAFVEVAFPSFHVSYMNQVARSLLGYDQADIEAGIHSYSLLEDSSLVEVLDAAARHMARSTWIGLPYEREPGQRIFQLTLVRKDGSRFPADVQGSYVLDDADQPCGVRYIFRDTTSRHEADLERARLAALVESSDDSIISRALDGTVLSWNGGAERMYGYTAQEMVGQTLDRIELPAVRGELTREISRQVAGERTVFESTRVARDGRQFEVSVSLFPVTDRHGEVVAVGGVGRDISERIRAAEDVRRSNDLLGALTAAQTLFIRDRNARAVFEGLLPSLLDLTGSEFGFIGEVLHRDGAPYLKTHAVSNIAWDAWSRGFYAENIVNGIEFTNLKSLFGTVLVNGEPLISNDPANDPRRGGLPSGHPPLNSFMGIPIHVGERMVGMIGIANRPGGYDDEVCEFLRPFVTTCGTILEAISIEIARQEAENRLDMAMRGADLALWEWEIQKKDMVARFPEGGSHGYDLSERQDLGWLMARVHPEDREMVTAAFTRHFSGELPVVECEHRVLNGFGEYRWLLTRGTIVSRDSAGRPLRAAGTFLDISDRKTAQDERERLEQQIRQGQKLESLGVFAGGIAHDFNNLLTAILGNLYLLNQELGPGPQSELLGEAKHAAERGAELVRRLLTFARPEVDRTEPVDIDRLISETAALARSVLTPSTHLVVRRSAGHAEVQGSAISLQQVLINLMVNARDAMPEGGTITVARRLVTVGPRHRWAPPQLPRGRYYVISVSDTGEGMPADLLERIFDPFFTTKDRGRGSGLGLPTALGIARGHGGWLSVESTPGQGSTFRLLLPAGDALPTSPS